MPRTTKTARDPSPSDDRLLRIHEVQSILNLSARKIFALAATGELSRIKLGRATRFRLSEVMTAVERGIECTTRGGKQ
jgi:excisionase family DNA binding protein